ncbi:MAG: hypothetical protein ACR2MO_10630 [Acidimicrobiales bacterium]
MPMRSALRARMVRRTFVVVLSLFLLAGFLGLLGVRTGTTRAEGGGYEMEVRYAQVARPGLSVPWAVTIRHPGGFDGPVTLATNSTYFDLFDENSFDPDPTSSTSDGERLIWEFEPPDGGDTMEISLDTRVGPNIQLGTSGTTEILEDGRPVAAVTYKTWIMP